MLGESREEHSSFCSQGDSEQGESHRNKLGQKVRKKERLSARQEADQDRETEHMLSADPLISQLRSWASQ